MFLRESHQSTTPSSEEPVDNHPGFKPGVATLMSPALFISSEEEMFAGGTSEERALRLRSRPCPRGPDRSGGGGCQRVWGGLASRGPAPPPPSPPPVGLHMGPLV